jgi:hypothetical protein
MVRSPIFSLSHLFLYESRYLSSENDPSKADMVEYETALKNTGCDLAPLTYVKK